MKKIISWFLSFFKHSRPVESISPEVIVLEDGKCGIIFSDEAGLLELIREAYEYEMSEVYEKEKETQKEVKSG